ncbi:MAG: hypothetical protein Tsb0020_45150 [Haliangiales bacterium]
MTTPAQAPANDADGPDQAAGQPPAALAAELRRYWRLNVTLMIGLLIIWALASLGCGVLFADQLNQFKLGGYPLGFWFAQQGSILIFVVLILTYAIALNYLDAQHHEKRDALLHGQASQGGAKS